MPKGTPFRGEYKQKVVEDMRTNHLSLRETAEKYGLQHHEKGIAAVMAAFLFLENKSDKSQGLGQSPKVLTGNLQCSLIRECHCRKVLETTQPFFNLPMGAHSKSGKQSVVFSSKANSAGLA